MLEIALWVFGICVAYLLLRAGYRYLSKVEKDSQTLTTDDIKGLGTFETVTIKVDEVIEEAVATVAPATPKNPDPIPEFALVNKKPRATKPKTIKVETLSKSAPANTYHSSTSSNTSSVSNAVDDNLLLNTVILASVFSNPSSAAEDKPTHQSTSSDAYESSSSHSHDHSSSSSSYDSGSSSSYDSGSSSSYDSGSSSSGGDF